MRKITEEEKKLNKIYSFNIVQDIDEVINKLSNNECIARFEYGDSMTPILNNGEYAILMPIHSVKDDINVGDAVFCKVNEHWMTHMVWIKNNDTNQCLIGSTNGTLYGWTDIIIAKAVRTKDRVIEGEVYDFLEK